MWKVFEAVWAFLRAWAAHWQWGELLVIWSRKVVKGPEGPIMTQLTLLGVAGWHLRLHLFHRGDGELYHSHPRGFISVCLRGAYREKLCEVPGDRLVQPGTITVRRATDRHNVEPVSFPCVTLAITTPVIRKWEKSPCGGGDG